MLKRTTVWLGNEVNGFILMVGFLTLPPSQLVLRSQHLVLIFIKYFSKVVVGFSCMSGMCISIIGRCYILNSSILQFVALKEKDLCYVEQPNPRELGFNSLLFWQIS